VTFDQAEFDLRCEWGIEGLRHLSPTSDVVIIVDVLSFSTAVDIAVSRGATVYPYRWEDASARAFAESRGALLAEKRSGKFSLAPASLRGLPRGASLVLPSPNGSELSFASTAKATFTACLRNCEAVAREALRRGSRIGLVPAGERWPDGTMRFGLEDLLGAGAVLAHLPGTRSPEAEAAVAAFEHFRGHLPTALSRCGSGKELLERGYPDDIEIAAECGASGSAPLLADGCYRGLVQQ
jgi:2-phosphosulfolactate phosphatase